MHSKPHGKIFDEDSELDVLCESEDDEQHLFDPKRCFLKKMEKLKDVDLLETLVVLKFKQIYTRAVQLRTEFEESFSLAKINPFLMKNMVPIILSQLVEELGSHAEFGPDLRSVLIAMLIRNLIDIHTFQRLTLDLHTLDTRKTDRQISKL